MSVLSEPFLDARSRAFDPIDNLPIGALRRIAVGRPDCPSLTRDLAIACGEDAREVLATLTVFLQVMTCGGSRPISSALPVGAPSPPTSEGCWP
jgi:hypothetical protein